MPDSIALPQPTSPFPIRPRSLLSVLLIGLVSLPSWADEIRIDATCSLGDAIVAANTDASVGGCVHDGLAGADTLLLDVDVVLTAADIARSSLLAGAHAGLPDVSSEITIQAGAGGSRIERHPGLSCTVADGPDEFRLLQVTGSGALTLEGLTLANGCADWGGALLSSGSATLTLRGSTFINNTARSAGEARGGAMASLSSGPIEITDSTFDGNSAYGSVARGGAVAADAPLALDQSRFIQNRAEATDALAEGGALYYAGAHAIAWSGLVFSANNARGGSSGGMGQQATGGAAYVQDVLPDSSIRMASFVGNQARGGDGSTEGGRGQGGGLYIAELTPLGSLEQISFQANHARGGDSTSGRGGAALGGGLLRDSGGMVDRHLSFSGNVAEGGASISGRGGEAGSGAGAFIVSAPFGSSLALEHLTVKDNQAIGGIGGTSIGQALTAGIFNEQLDPMTIVSSVFENNLAIEGAVSTPSDCGDEDLTTVSLGYNLVAAPGNCVFNGPGDQINPGASLLPLGEYGCATMLPDGSCLPTHPVAIGSPAHDAGSCSASGVTADARGYSRPWDDPDIANLDDGCDAGAYESRDLDNDGFDDDYASMFANGFE